MAPIFFTRINQPKVNNIAAFTRAGHKKILSYAWYKDAQVYALIASFFFWNQCYQTKLCLVTVPN